MVYRGPSSGCSTCRKRRVKCDENTPGCGNCLKLRVRCPGYKDVFERRHRSETRKVVGRNGGHSRCTNILVPESSDSAKASLKDQVDSTSSPITSPSIVLPPPLDFEYLSLSFFFQAYGSNGGKDGTCSLFAIIGDLYAECTQRSPLFFATCALAIKIAGLWSQHDANLVPAHRRYAEAVTCTKEAIKDPTKNKSDELLMTALILEVYDDISAKYQHGPRASVHLSGSMALLKHRGEMNYRDDVSRRIMLAARNKIIADAILSRRNIPELPTLFQQADERMPANPAIEVDRLAFRVSKLSNLMRSEGKTSAAVVEGAENERGPSFLTQAATLAADCTRWINSLPDHWHPVRVNGDAIAETIQAAGLYDESCDVYINFSVAATRNWHRLIELHVLLLLCQCSANITSHPAHNIVLRAENIVTEICASVPYHVGDMMEPTRPINGPRVRFPQIRMPPSTHVTHASFPESILKHERQIASSGAMVIYRVLTTVILLAQDEGQAASFLLKHNQRLWISAQILRLKRLLRFPRSGQI
ncbi:unnamed protein product [Clonostachys rhizophaga]|uniref:Zn(2)-C6 fungal-type domain-containing protein n=1 Tax=Clonostachys rhizophaga TaxID=160324 RepID=A0A9N9VGT6_9HYPO|nr:unnamed protein product [Clonostachys rhizophaga]